MTASNSESDLPAIEPAKLENPTNSDDEDDCEGDFLEPVNSNVNIAEKVAEANRKLFQEEEEENVIQAKTTKVQFSDELGYFEPPDFSDSDWPGSAHTSTISEEDEKFLEESAEQEEDLIDETLSNRSNSNKGDSQTEEEIEEIEEEVEGNMVPNFNEDEENNKLLLILLPKEQSSSCESIIGEDIFEENTKGNKRELVIDIGKVMKPKTIRPKSASAQKYKKSYEVSKISPDLKCSTNFERKGWQRTSSLHAKTEKKKDVNGKTKNNIQKVTEEAGRKIIKKINVDQLDCETFGKGTRIERCADNRPKSSFCRRKMEGNGNRPNTAPSRRSCCIIKSDLPNYNGLKSEYGLSAEQLQERKRKTVQTKHKKKEKKLKEIQEEIRKRNQNEETFRRWVLSKSKKSTEKRVARTLDTLTRSDAYIQAHASYATNRNVPYSVDYSLTRKIGKKGKVETKAKHKTSKILALENLFDRASPHFKRSFNIYLGVKKQ